jgi:hypothetical protein
MARPLQCDPCGETPWFGQQPVHNLLRCGSREGKCSSASALWLKKSLVGSSPIVSI